MQKNENKKCGFEPRTFGTEGRCPTHYTTVSLGKFCKKIKKDNIQCQKLYKTFGGKFKWYLQHDFVLLSIHC